MFQMDLTWFRVDPWQIITLVIIVVAFVVFAVQRGIQAHRRQAEAGKEEMVGKIAVVKTALDPKGTVFIQDEIWVAISEKGRVEPEEEVMITKVDGLKLYVAKKEQ